MKIRSTTELNTFLNDELAWRKHELVTVHLELSHSRSHVQAILLRAGICLLYAHWEGFIKRAASAYLNYVSKQGLQLMNLQPSLIALCLRSDFATAEMSQRVTIRTKLTQRLLAGLNIAAEVPWDDAIDTRSNLNWEVLQEILCLLDLSDAAYATKKALIDGKLVYYRNNIAHGQRIDIDASDYEDLHKQIINMIDMFRNDVENAALTRAYRRG